MVTFREDVYGPLDRGMAILQLCCWKFLHKNFAADFIRLNLLFMQKNTKSLFEPHIGAVASPEFCSRGGGTGAWRTGSEVRGDKVRNISTGILFERLQNLRAFANSRGHVPQCPMPGYATALEDLGVTYALHLIARWKVRGRLPIRHNWTFFAISFGWDVISGNLSVGVFSKELGHFERKFQTEGASPTNDCWCQKTRVIALSCSIKISAVHALFGFVTKHACNRQTDGQNYDSQDSAGIAARAVKIAVVTKPNNALRIFWCHMKGQSLQFSDTNMQWLVEDALSVWKWP